MQSLRDRANSEKQQYDQVLCHHESLLRVAEEKEHEAVVCFSFLNPYTVDSRK